MNLTPMDMVFSSCIISFAEYGNRISLKDTAPLQNLQLYLFFSGLQLASIPHFLHVNTL